MSTIDTAHINRKKHNTSNGRSGRQKHRPTEEGIELMLGVLDGGEGMTVPQLELATGYCNSAVFKILKELDERGLIVRTKESHGFGWLETTVRLK
jgi:hypothetical protein